ncbi:class I SAM-dependent methyltransferase [Streptomyces sp. NPDC088387]|uniref:class I SAM-dependent methyltransferase n=1 Tax=Streptomyces sp. NPDC088387 TaxID=3365859 RepID=UPI003812F417
MTTPSPASRTAQEQEQEQAQAQAREQEQAQVRARSFNSAAAQYAANRPSYPPALFDAIEELSGRPLAGALVADVGAGTGIATALLRQRGAEIIAVEPGDGMAAQFRRTLPDVLLVRGDGDHLPLTDASVDLVTYAQAWHWTDPARSLPEARRVLRPGGALALWWNRDALDVPWIAEQSDRIRRHFARDLATEMRRITESATSAPSGLDFTVRRVRWSRQVPLDTHLANLASHSIFLVADEDHRTTFLAQERAHLLRHFPDEVIEETYDVDLLLARKP